MSFFFCLFCVFIFFVGNFQIIKFERSHINIVTTNLQSSFEFNTMISVHATSALLLYLFLNLSVSRHLDNVHITDSRLPQVKVRDAYFQIRQLLIYFHNKHNLSFTFSKLQGFSLIFFGFRIKILFLICNQKSRLEFLGLSRA